MSSVFGEVRLLPYSALHTSFRLEAGDSILGHTPAHLSRAARNKKRRIQIKGHTRKGIAIQRVVAEIVFCLLAEGMYILHISCFFAMPYHRNGLISYARSSRFRALDLCCCRKLRTTQHRPYSTLSSTAES